MSRSKADARPALAFRVGVTGSRALAPLRESQIANRVAEVLAFIRDEVGRLAGHALAKTIYQTVGGTVPAPRLEIVSPLAAGADQLVATEALKLSFGLIAPLPFTQIEYQKDFGEDHASFHALLSQATVIELDGARGTDEAPSYEAGGRFVVRNCDLLIAIWDCRVTGKQGGTAEIMRFAAKSGVPIWWIHAGVETAERWIGSELHWRQRETDTPSNAMEALKTYLNKIVLPPEFVRPTHHSMIGRGAHHWRHFTGRDHDPLQTFLSEHPDGGTRAWPWQAYSWFLARLVKTPHNPRPLALPKALEASRYWDARYQHADALSVAYGDRYRSSYFLIILFAFLIISLSKLGGSFTDGAMVVTMVLELAMLFAVTVLAFFSHVHVWHEKWVSYRLVAELCREQTLLCSLGIRLPRPELSRLAADNASYLESKPSQGTWVAWYTEALSRAAPWPACNSLDAKTHAREIGLHFVAEQTAYHRRRSHQSENADSRLGAAGELCFFATVAGVTIRLALTVAGVSTEATEWIETMATVFSAASAAFVGIRFYSEFGLLNRQSLRMQRIMADAGAALALTPIDTPLATRELSQILYNLALSMLFDLREWVELFGIKTVETS